MLAPPTGTELKLIAHRRQTEDSIHFAADSIDIITISNRRTGKTINIDKPRQAVHVRVVLEIGALDCIAYFLPEREKRETTRREGATHLYIGSFAHRWERTVTSLPQSVTDRLPGAASAGA